MSDGRKPVTRRSRSLATRRGALTPRTLAGKIPPAPAAEERPSTEDGVIRRARPTPPTPGAPAASAPRPVAPAAAAPAAPARKLPELAKRPAAPPPSASRALEERLAALEEKLVELARRPAATHSGADVEDAMEARVADLAGSIEAQAVTRTLDVVGPKLEELLAERLRSLESRLAPRAAGPSVDAAALEAKLTGIVSDKVRALEAQLALAFEAKSKAIVAENLDALEKAIATSPTQVVTAPPAAPDGLAREQIELLVAQRVKEAVDFRAHQLATDVIQGQAAFEKRMLGIIDHKLATFEERIAEIALKAGGVTMPPPEKMAYDICATTLFKDTLDKRFRVLIQHVEQEVVPKATRKLASPPPEQAPTTNE